MGKKNKKKQRNVAGAGDSGGISTMKFMAPMSGLEDVYVSHVGHGQGRCEVRGHGEQVGAACGHESMDPLLGGIGGNIYFSYPNV